MKILICSPAGVRGDGAGRDAELSLIFPELELALGKPEFGRKVTCTACAVRFFDLTRSPAICPKCGVEQPRIKPRVAPAARAAAVRWAGGRQPPMIIEAAAPEPTLIEADPVEDVDEDEDEIEEADLPDDEDETPKVKHDD